MRDYQEWLESKSHTGSFGGVDTILPLNESLFPHQRAIVQWALKRGRCAIFADTGLGKSLMQLEWARHVAQHGRVLILAPLAVAEQTVDEGAKFGVACAYRRHDCGDQVTVTNYEMLEKFDVSRFVGVVIDESSILKAYDGKFRNLIISSFAKTPYRLACTATPAPNDHMELGNHSEFLGVKSRVEMLAEYFVHDGGDTSKWRLKGHAEDVFWRWVCSWAVMIKRPGDLGFDDAGYNLPPLLMREEVVGVEHQQAWAQGMLFAPPALSLSDQRATRRMTMDQRVATAAKIANECDNPVLIWCELNDEADAIERVIPDAVQVKGSDSHDVKRKRLLGFSRGEYRVLVTKSSIAGFGMNWQHCAKMVFAGASHSYEQTYQAIRRCYRFGQTRPVEVTVIRAETEDAIIRNFERKSIDADVMAEAMLRYMRDAMAEEIGAARREWNEYAPAVEMIVPEWIGEEVAA